MRLFPLFLKLSGRHCLIVGGGKISEGKIAGLLCNIVDVPGLCDFYYPAVVQRGDLQIAISTGGASPSLAKRLRQQLEKEFAPEYADWLKTLARQRQKIRKRNLAPAEQMRLLEALSSDAAFSNDRQKRARVRTSI